MDKENLLKQGQRIIAKFHNNHAEAVSDAVEFLRVYAGEKSSFYRRLSKIDASRFINSIILDNVKGALQAFINHIENDITEGISLERKIQVETVSDFLEQANVLLNTSNIHPGAPAMIIGAALEEFLRNWSEEIDAKLAGKPSIDNYAKALRDADLINKQDYKDITSWGGLRNEAAHGNWEAVNDRNRVSIMLEGVNLFMRKYAK